MEEKCRSSLLILQVHIQAVSLKGEDWTLALSLLNDAVAKIEKGKKSRDGLASLKQTYFRLGLSFWEYSLKWFQGKPPDLAQLVRERYRAVTP